MARLLAVLVVFGLSCPVMAQEVPETVSGASTVNVLQARVLYEQGAMFVDVRPQREWSWGHISGAIHLDGNTRFAELSNAPIPRGTALVVYCDSDVSPSSAEAVRKAVSWGYQQVYFFRDGYFAWQLLDFPLDKGASDDSPLYAMSGRLKRAVD
ncbi:rhodanese-like domain-containing protein [Pseudomonas sp. EL_65y_Pfl2_R95]|uniref:rhodanese-like domain-containing protein n=1 Tax=Pseudomonas sp. EL_65y_Pfl2_R95 TaxID=3088698 RepID=UPI0030DA94B7